MGWLLEALQARAAAARTRVKALQAEMDRLAEHLAAEQELLGRLGITRQTGAVALSDDTIRLPPLSPPNREIEGAIERLAIFLAPSGRRLPPLR